MQTLTDYKRDITAEVIGLLRSEDRRRCSPPGSNASIIILDPGFGFAKTTEQNYELLGRACTVSAHWATPYWRASRASR